MKALIVDDEKAAVIAVKMLVDWKKYKIDTVYEVNSSEDVLPLIRTEEIQIIISDVRMPGMNGLELISEIHKIRPNTKVIMISGYGQFDYVRSALQLGCADYILKPIDEEQINRAVEKAVREWQRDVSIQAIEHSYHEIDSQMKKAQAQRLMLVFLNSANREVAYGQLCELLPEFRKIKRFRIANLYTKHLPEEVLQGEQELSILADLANDVVYDAGCALAIMRRLHGNIQIFFDADRCNVPLLCQQILYVLYQKSKVHFPLGLSDAWPIDQDVGDAVRQAGFRARSVGVSLIEKGEFWEQEEWTAKSGAFQPFEENLHKAVLSGYDHMIRKAVEETIRGFTEGKELHLSDLEMIQQDYQMMRIRWLEGFRLSRARQKQEVTQKIPDPCFRLPFDEHGLFSPKKMEDNLYQDLQNLALYFRDTMGAGENDGAIFQQIEQYLLMHYTERITIGLIAEEFALSESYLSRAFKKNIGMGIPDYLNHLRIRKAKELLLNPQMKILDIAYLLGYQDEKYFSRVFHKLEGKSPQQYRLEKRG
ncbi:response regulator transcription factor [Hominifimenecus sp. rT4P-3]|uniref:response regulator transcription factor n=1 Tax=Hominifimenecus sp. rT4P-3 TaxID=3242979 RepID=UPI003DA5D788